MNELEKFRDKEKLHKLLDAYNPGHDQTQMNYFIVGSGVTDYGKYKQALAELYSHYSALQTHYIEQKKLKAKIAIFEARLLSLSDSQLDQAKRLLLEVEIEEKELALESLKKQIARNLNELNTMFNLAQEYEKSIEGRDKAELEREYHLERLSKLLAINTVFKGGNLSGVAETILTLPEAEQAELMNRLHSLQITAHQNELLYFESAKEKPALLEKTEQ